MTSALRFLQAVEEGDAERVTRMLEGSPELVNARTEAGASAVLAALYRGHGATVDVLRARGAVLDVFDAAAVGDGDRLALLLAQSPGAPHARRADGWTPLHLACFFGRREAAQRLLEAGAEVNAASGNATRNTPLHAALAGARDAELVERLLAAGAEVNARGGGGFTPLHLAAARGDIASIEALLVRGARPMRTDAGQSPAEIAAERGHADTAARLRALE